MESQLPEITESTFYCGKKAIDVKGIKREVVYDNMLYIFYLCEHIKVCKYKLSCLYKFPDDFYYCKNCETLMKGLPGYKVKPVSRFCMNCEETVENSLMLNARLAGL